MTLKVRWHKAHRLREHRFLRIVEAIFWIAGGLAVGFCALAYFHATVYQSYESREFERSLKLAAPRGTAIIHDGLCARTVSRLEIPRLAVSVMVAEGVAPQTLRLGAGHIPGTALPTEVGNVGIAAHRDTFFRALRGIHLGDEITLTTLDGSYRYVVEWTRIADPQERDVLAASNEPVLTLVTCYPFYYIGPAPQRFIVRARRIG
jgi:sortase A